VPFLAVEIPDDRIAFAIAEEAAIADRDLDAIEARLARGEGQPAELAALALTLGRAGRRESAPALEAVEARLFAGGRTLEAQAAHLARELLAPPAWLERAERGYRRIDPRSHEELFIEDPLAAHWHHLRRWGPPIRAESSAPHFTELSAGANERIARGEIALVIFDATRRFKRLERPLRLARAGLSRTATFDDLTRWTAVRSVGITERRLTQHASYELAHGERIVLPAQKSVAALVALMTELMQAARR
jgi:hypothetical protein